MFINSAIFLIIHPLILNVFSILRTLYFPLVDGRGYEEGGLILFPWLRKYAYTMLAFRSTHRQPHITLSFSLSFSLQPYLPLPLSPSLSLPLSPFLFPSPSPPHFPLPPSLVNTTHSQIPLTSGRHVMTELLMAMTMSSIKCQFPRYIANRLIGSKHRLPHSRLGVGGRGGG